MRSSRGLVQQRRCVGDDCGERARWADADGAAVVRRAIEDRDRRQRNEAAEIAQSRFSSPSPCPKKKMDTSFHHQPAAMSAASWRGYLIFAPDVELAQVTSSGWPASPSPARIRICVVRRRSICADEQDRAVRSAVSGAAARRAAGKSRSSPRSPRLWLPADFRLRDAGAYARWYGAAHPAPE